MARGQFGQQRRHTLDRMFFALVGATGSGKNTMLERLKTHFSRDQSCDVHCDSNAAASRVTTSFTHISTPICGQRVPISELLDMWARLSHQIETEVLPLLEKGHRVIMNGFGGTAYAEAVVHARSPQEKHSLLAIHKAAIAGCVLSVGVPPPEYLWLEVSPEVALQRRRSEKSLPKVSDPARYIEELNRQYEFYGRLPGQTVHRINANRPLDEVFEEVLARIDPSASLARAA